MRKAFFLLALVELSSCTYNDVKPIQYFPKVKAIISDNCMQCHSSTGSWYGRPVAFDTDDQIVSRASDIKTAVVNKIMPKGGSLSQDEINTIVAWVNAGGHVNN